VATQTLNDVGLGVEAPVDVRRAACVTYDARPTILVGTQQIVAAMSEIDGFKRSIGLQHDLATNLYLILSRHNSAKRRLVVVLLRLNGELRAAVIFAERSFAGVGIGLLRAGDQTGDGAVIAPLAERREALLAAMDVLLKLRCCHTVTATLSGVRPGEFPVSGEAGTLVEREYRVVRRYFPLSATLDETLRKRFSPKKRKNLLYYQRALFKQGDVVFVPEISSDGEEQAIVQLSGHSWPHRSQAEIGFHCDFLRSHPECFCMGLCGRDGTWLSLITGWRVNGVTHMPWQLNDERYKHASLMQVMRTCMLEHECSLGQTAVSWVGGTVSFKTGCEPEFCVDVLKARRGWISRVLRNAIVPLMFRRNPQAFTGGSLMLLIPAKSRAAERAPLDPDS
jgi:hypothetical protein